MFRILRQSNGAATPRAAVVLLLLLVATAPATTTDAQATTRTILFNLNPSAVYDIYKDGSALTSTYSTAGGAATFVDVTAGGGTFAVVPDTTVDTTPPTPPLIMSADENEPGCALILWLASGDPDVIAYEVGLGTRSVAGGDAPAYDRLVNVGNVTDHQICGLDIGRYYVAVRARNHLWIPSAFSTELELTVSSLAVTITAFNAATGDGGGAEVELSWDIFSDEKVRGFEIFRSPAGDAGRGVAVHGPGMLPPAARSHVDRSAAPATSYRYTLVAIGEDGAEAAWFARTVTTAAVRLDLEQNVPNPFNPQTTISFVLDSRERIRLEVYDVAGRLVITLADGVLPAGRHRLPWDGRDRLGAPVATGTYFYRLTAGRRSISRKMLLVK